MSKRRVFYLFIIFNILFSPVVLACDACSCSITRGSMKEAVHRDPWFFDFTVEQQNWNALDSRAAHELHHDGHHVHNKTHEEFYHYTLGANLSEEWTFLAEIPYIVKTSLDVEHHRTLGQKQVSEGLGDMKLFGVYRFLRENDNFLALTQGVKMPTGSTDEKDPAGNLFEPELQPGTGSYDYSFGTAFQYTWNPVTLHGNILYVLKTKGEQDFEYGDLFSSYVYLNYLINPSSPRFQTKIGLDANLQVENRQRQSGVRLEDSGGTTLLMGPSMSLQASKNISIFGNFLFPAYQNLGGIHQEMDYVWNSGCKVSW